ncbi:TRAP transporter substrate-binding protein DctP [Ectothiorhodospiraceae bacterium WFHF3C12]|nr:TRAP transporter substrate-binding protein DctP [Ectothiorhodospiraceae bacterium WFHF3C12]
MSIKGVLIGIAVGFGLAASAAQAEVTILFNSYEPPHGGMPKSLQPWMDEVEEVTDGRVKFRVPPSTLGPPPQQLQLVTGGVADGAYVLNTWMRNHWKLPQLAELPLLGGSAEASAVALWRTYQKYFKQAEEYKDVVLLGYCAAVPTTVFNLEEEPVTSVSQLEGQRVFSPDSLAEPLGELGAAAVTGPVVKAHNQLSKGVVDLAAGFSFFIADAYNAMPYLNAATEIPGGLWTPTFSVFLSKSAWNRIPPKDQELIRSVSGERLARHCGYWDEQEAKSREKFVGDGRAVEAASPQMMESIREVAAPMRQAWLEAAESRGVDGEAALTYFREQLEAELQE